MWPRGRGFADLGPSHTDLCSIPGRNHGLLAHGLCLFLSPYLVNPDVGSQFKRCFFRNPSRISLDQVTSLCRSLSYDFFLTVVKYLQQENQYLLNYSLQVYPSPNATPGLRGQVPIRSARGSTPPQSWGQSTSQTSVSDVCPAFAERKFSLVKIISRARAETALLYPGNPSTWQRLQ